MSAEHPGGGPGPGGVSDRMRALLSRAAEEQLHEQRQVSTVLGELRALVADVDERSATGEQVERLTADLRVLSERVEARLDAAEARAGELADRIGEATAMVGRAAQDLVEAVVAGVVDRLEAPLREATGGVTTSVSELLAGSERRLGTHVDDAVLALAEVVLRRRRAAVAPAAVVEEPAAVAVDEVREPAVGTQPVGGGPDVDATAATGGAEPEQDLPRAEPPSSGAVVEADQPEAAASGAETEPDSTPGEAEVAAAGPEAGLDTTAGEVEAAAGSHTTSGEPDRAAPAADVGAASMADAVPVGHPSSLDAPVSIDLRVPAVDEAGAEHGDEPDPYPGDGFVLVPADVEEVGLEPAPLVQHERRTTQRRTSDRSDGSGRRRRPWWRPV